MGLQNPELSILLLDDRQIAPLNTRYLQRTGPTDVISFPMHDRAFAQVQPALLGDIVISVAAAQRQADQRGSSLAAELSLLLIHGILHLLGYDHEASPAQAKKMRAREKELFRIISRE